MSDHDPSGEPQLSEINQLLETYLKASDSQDRSRIWIIVINMMIERWVRLVVSAVFWVVVLGLLVGLAALSIWLSFRAAAWAGAAASAANVLLAAFGALKVFSRRGKS